MLLDQTIAGRRCTLWVPEGTGPFALSLCCCGSAPELLPQLGARSPHRLVVSREAWADCLRCGPSVKAKPSPSAPAFPARCGIRAG